MMTIKKSIVTAGLIASLFTYNIAIADDGQNIKRAMILDSFTTNLSDIVKAKEKKGIQVIKAELEKQESIFSTKEEPMIYEIVTSDGKTDKIKYYIDPMTGKDIDSKKITNWNPFDDDTQAMTKFSMSQAIDLAVKELGGKVYEAELEEDDGINYYELKILTDSGVKKAIVNPNSGKMYLKKRGNKDRDHENDEN